MAPFWFMTRDHSNHALLLQYVKKIMELSEESRQLLSELKKWVANTKTGRSSALPRKHGRDYIFIMVIRVYF